MGLNTADLHSNIEGDGGDAFCKEWNGLGPDHVDASFYVPVDSELACNVWLFENRRVV